MKKLSILLTLIMFISTGCSFLKIKTKKSETILQEIAISMAAKGLGQKLYRDGIIKWDDGMEKFYNYIKDNGLNIDTTFVVLNYIDTNIPELYKDDIDNLVDLIGIELVVSGPDMDGQSLKNLFIAIKGVRAGILFEQKK